MPQQLTEKELKFATVNSNLSALERVDRPRRSDKVSVSDFNGRIGGVMTRYLERELKTNARIFIDKQTKTIGGEV